MSHCAGLGVWTAWRCLGRPPALLPWLPACLATAACLATLLPCLGPPAQPLLDLFLLAGLLHLLQAGAARAGGRAGLVVLAAGQTLPTWAPPCCLLAFIPRSSTIANRNETDMMFRRIYCPAVTKTSLTLVWTGPVLLAGVKLAQLVCLLTNTAGPALLVWLDPALTLLALYCLTLANILAGELLPASSARHPALALTALYALFDSQRPFFLFLEQVSSEHC